MKMFLKVGGFMVVGFGLLVLLDGEAQPGIIFMLIGAGIVVFSQFFGGFQFYEDFSKKRARKELMELKSLLDNGVLNEDEYEEKSKALKSKV